MVRIGNAPDTASLEQRVFRFIRNCPFGRTRKSIDAKFRDEAPQTLDETLRCLQSVKLIAFTTDRWWAR